MDYKKAMEKDGFTLDLEKEATQLEDARLKKMDYKKALDKFERREWIREHWWLLIVLAPAIFGIITAIIGLITHPEWQHGEYNGGAY